MSLHIIDEAKRCLHCKKPQCAKGCPINTNIPEMIKMLLKGEIREAGDMLFSNNPLSLLCSFVCNHEKQCEGHCVLSRKGQSVHISTIENYISNYFLNFPIQKYTGERKEKIAIIGSGPAGLTISIILAQRGYDITIFESRERIGGVLRYGIPEFRLPKTALEKYTDKLLELGIKIRPNTVIGHGGLVIDDLFRDGYKAIFIGTGVWKPNSLGIKGESLGNVHFAINYLKNPDVYHLGQSVIIIGAGNAAMDVARTVVRKGVRDITVFFIMGEEQLTASKSEVAYAIVEGIKFEYFKSPVEITDRGVVFSDTRLIQKDDGSVWYENIENTTQLYEADSVIVSISQGPRNYIVATTEGLHTDQKGLIVADGAGRTTREGIFASGDVVSGAKTVVEAVNYSKKVADSMEQYVISLRHGKKGKCV